jgi:hypothetical protein
MLLIQPTVWPWFDGKILRRGKKVGRLFANVSTLTRPRFGIAAQPGIPHRARNRLPIPVNRRRNYGRRWNCCLHEVTTIMPPALNLPPGVRLISDSLRPPGGAAGNFGAQLPQHFGKRRRQGVIPPLGKNIRPGRDQVRLDLIRRTGARFSGQPDLRGIDPQPIAHCRQLFLHPQIQFGRHRNAQGLYCQFHRYAPF